MADEYARSDAYQPKDAIAGTLKVTAITGTAGLFVSTVQNVLTKQNVGIFGVFTRTGATITTFAAAGGAYEFARTASANLRRKDDTYNEAWGGFFAGSMLGLRFRSFPAIIGHGVGLATVLAVLDYTGGRLQGKGQDPEIDEVARKEYLRKNRRKPIEEIVNELGEGRGIYGPGYEERRAERIKAAYGIDVPASSASAS